MCRLLLCIPIFRKLFFIKKYKKKCVCVVGLKIALLFVKNVLFDVKNGISELWGWVAQKHTTNVF